MEACNARIIALSERVSNSIQLSKKQRESEVLVRRNSMSDLRPEFLSTMSATSATRLCHHCHAPQSNPVHVGIPTGAGHCTLKHWEECQLQKEEGYDKRKKWWTGCPNLVDIDLDTMDVDLDMTKEENPEIADTDDLEEEDDDEIKLKIDCVTSSDESDDDTDEEEERLAAEEIEKLRIRVEEQAKQIKEDEIIALKVAQKEQKRSERSQRRAELEKRRSELLTMEKLNLQQLSAVGGPSGLSRSAPRSIPSDQLTSAKSAADKLKSKAAAHAAKQQKAAAERVQLQNANKMTIGGIRKLPGMTQAVENHLTGFQSSIPSLAKDPSASMQSGVQFQPAGVLNTAAGGLAVAPGYVYVAELGQLVPTVSSLGTATRTILPKQTKSRFMTHQNSSPRLHHSDSEVSADEDCPVSPTPGHRLVWRIDSQGRKYCEEKAVREQSPEVVTTWVKRADGRIYKEQVTTSKSRDKVTGNKSQECSTPLYVDHRQGLKQVKAGRSSGNREERQPTFISTEERAGKDTSIPSLVKHARMCPVSWTAKITTEQLNPIVWSWAFIAELLASRTGQAEDLPVGELEVRLQHFLHVMEVNLQTSTRMDYTGDSWKVGRLYHNKV